MMPKRRILSAASLIFLISLGFTGLIINGLQRNTLGLALSAFIFATSFRILSLEANDKSLELLYYSRINGFKGLIWVITGLSLVAYSIFMCSKLLYGTFNIFMSLIAAVSGLIGYVLIHVGAKGDIT